MVVKHVLVWFTEQTLQAEENTLHIVDRAPLVFQDVQAYPSREVDIGMIDGRLEQNRWGGIGIVSGKGEAKLEVQARVRCLSGARDCGGPR